MSIDEAAGRLVGECIRFVVTGEPATAGSKQAFPYRKKTGGLGVRVTEDNPRSKHWRTMVAYCAREVYRGPLLDGAVRLTLTFIRPRPQGHFRTGKNAGRLKEDAPKYPTTRPDCTKMVRAVEDALKGVIWRDDAQVVEQRIEKVYGEPAGCVVLIEPLTPAAAS